VVAATTKKVIAKILGIELFLIHLLSNIYPKTNIAQNEKLGKFAILLILQISYTILEVINYYYA
jgi:hypothetical protein